MTATCKLSLKSKENPLSYFIFLLYCYLDLPRLMGDRHIPDDISFSCEWNEIK